MTREISFVLVEELSESGRWLQRAACRLTREGVDSDIRLARVSQGSGAHVEGAKNTRFDWPVPVTATEQVCQKCDEDWCRIGGSYGSSQPYCLHDSHERVAGR